MGFTLIELLVVVTIIVVLLALLTPTLDKAIYQAVQVKCGAQLKGFGNGLTTGATERKRLYPKRLIVNFQSIAVNDPSGNDERPELVSYLGTSLNKMLNCPLTIPVDIDRSAINMYAQTSYAMWHGWRTGPTEKRMSRLGDDWTYTAPGASADRFRVLANDYELGNAENYYSGQPDRDDVLTPYVVQDAVNQTTSTWYAPLARLRGKIDMNVVYTDGSVTRILDIKHFLTPDDRMTFVPNTMDNANDVNNWQRVPTP